MVFTNPGLTMPRRPCESGIAHRCSRYDQQVLALQNLMNRRKPEIPKQSCQSLLAAFQILVVPEARQQPGPDSWLAGVYFPGM